MRVRFPGESNNYRAARDRQLGHGPLEVSAERRFCWRRALHFACVLAGLVAMSLLVSACSGSSGTHVAQLTIKTTATTAQSSPSTATSVESTHVTAVLAFSRCMRSHGVPEFPDPPPSGKLAVPSAQSLGVSSTHFQTAQSACQRLLPNGGSGTSEAEDQQEWSQFRSFARCMRRHGVPNWPDPRPRSATDPRPIFPIQPVDPTSPVDPNTPQIRSELHDCDQLLRTANPNRL